MNEKVRQSEQSHHTLNNQTELFFSLTTIGTEQLSYPVPVLLIQSGIRKPQVVSSSLPRSY
jgi:hypothetical protein